MTVKLEPILALARAGSTSRAWDAFMAAGLDAVADDPNVLTLKGRLLKDQARAARDDSRARLFLRSAKAYADASALQPDSYPLINAAAMSLFAGQAGHAVALASQVLMLIQTGVGGGETPYWHWATQAEAQLLLGEAANAEASFAKAIAHAPQAWEDHATTLRQFRLILQYRHEEAGWLDRYAPPVSLCYSGIIGIAADDDAARLTIEGAVDAIGAAFGYGALAAGADIIIAEALLKNGADLHLILPAIPSRFKEVSVDPFGIEWVRRFDAAFEAAISVTVVEPAAPMSDAAIKVAAQVSMGRAIDNAQRMESGVVALKIISSDRAGNAHQFPAGITVKTICVDRSASVPGVPLAETETAAVLVVDQNGDEMAAFADADQVDIDQGRLVATFRDIGDAVIALERCLAENADRTIALDYRISDGTPTTGDAHRGRAIRMSQAATPGTIIMSADAAMAYKCQRPDSRLEPLGDLPSHEGPIALFAIRL